MAPRLMSPMTTLSRWPWILRRSYKSRGGLFTRSGSEADSLFAEWLSATVNAGNRWWHSPCRCPEAKKYRRSETRGRNRLLLDLAGPVSFSRFNLLNPLNLLNHSTRVCSFEEGIGHPWTYRTLK